MKELDVLLLRYMERCYESASHAEQEAFRGLLEAPDPLIHAYCLGRQTPPTPLLSSLIRSITEGRPAP
jgi:antitoxin CptB